MQHSLSPSSVELNSIDLTDRTFYFSPIDKEIPDEKLVESIKNFGILEPPILFQRGNKKLIVSGWRRILAARQIMSHASIQALMLPSVAKKNDAFQIIAEENSFKEKLSPAEQAVFFTAYLKQNPLTEALPLLEKFGHKPQKHILLELLSLLELDKSALLAIHDGKISLKAARKLHKLPPVDQKLLIDIIQSLHLGGSKQQKLLDYCTELLKRNSEPLANLLKAFLHGEESTDTKNIPQKAAGLLTWLHKKCCPRSTSAEEEFRRTINELNLPKHMRLDHTPSFEDDRVTLSIKFHNLQEAAKTLPSLHTISKEPSE